MKDKVFQIFEKSSAPLKAGEIAGQYGIDKKDVDKAIKELKEEGRIESPKRCYYAIKK